MTWWQIPMPGRNHVEAVECLHSPFQEFVARAIAAKLHLHVHLEGVRPGPDVDLDRVIHDESHRNERLDDAGIPAETVDRGPHRGQIDEERNAREILKENPRDDERDFRGALGPRFPAGQGADVFLADAAAVDVSQNGLENDPQADGEATDRAEPRLLERGKRIESGLPAVAEVEFGARMKRVGVHAVQMKFL